MPIETSAATIIADLGQATPSVNKDKGLFGLKPMNCPDYRLILCREDRS